MLTVKEMSGMPQVPEQCPQDVADCIRDCMKAVPEDRPTTRDIFIRLRRCSKPRDNGGSGKDSSRYPGSGSGSGPSIGSPNSSVAHTQVHSGAELLPAGCVVFKNRLCPQVHPQAQFHSSNSV